ncbi:MAG: FecR family protein [Verrucomicrobiota bacterium]
MNQPQSEWVIRYLEGNLDEESKAELANALEENPHFAEGFAEELVEVSLMVQACSRLKSLEPQSQYPINQLSGPPRRARLTHHLQRYRQQNQQSPVLIGLVAVLVISLSLAVFFRFQKNQAKPIVENSSPQAVEAPALARLSVEKGSLVSWTRGGTPLDPLSSQKAKAGDQIKVLNGFANLTYLSDETTLHLKAGSILKLLAPAPGKMVHFSAGELTANVAPQANGRPFKVQTGNALIEVLGTIFSIRSEKNSTNVNVLEGSVGVQRLSDQTSVHLEQGDYTTVRKTGELTSWQLALGVNFNGDACVIDGNQWWSQKQAERNGMIVEVNTEIRGFDSVVTPLDVEPGSSLEQMLMCNITAKDRRKKDLGGVISLRQPLPNGRYQIFLWSMANSTFGLDYARSINLQVEDKLVETGMEADLPHRAWKKYGPYEVLVADGRLDLSLEADKTLMLWEPHISGMAIFKAN